MKYYLLVIIITVFVFASCKKTNSSNARVLFYNATWSLPAFTVAWNGGAIVTTGIAPGQSSGTADSPYVQVPAGTNLVTLKAGATTLLDKNIYTASAAGNSFFLYDTGSTRGATGILQLNDDLALPDTAQIKYRILDLSPDTAVTVDIWLVNGTADSIRLDTAATFIGKNAAVVSYETFSAMKYHGERYTIKVKKTGTQQLYASIANYSFAIRGIYTIVFSGLLKGTAGTALKLSVLHHRT